MALIRCKKCGSLTSDRTQTCPVCGEPNTPNATPTTNDTTAAPRTLNDILAEREKPQTLNDSMGEPVVESAQSGDVVSADTERVVEPKANGETESDTVAGAKPVATPVASVEQSAAASPTPQASDAEQTYDDIEVEALLTRNKRVIMALTIAVAVLAVAAGALSIFFFKYHEKLATVERDYAIVQSARKLFEEQNTMLQSEAADLVTTLEKYKSDSDSMMQRYDEAVQMLEKLKKESTYNYEQLTKYKREVNTLKGMMKGYIRQIDSLNTVNGTLQAQNVAYKREITSANLRADVAEEKADELNTKVRIGAVIQASGIKMVAINNRGVEVRRIKQATRLRTDFELTANQLAEPGMKNVYICITAPDGYPLSAATPILFPFEGEEMMASAMREVSYENQSVPVSIFYDGAAFAKGVYRVDIYVDGRLSGSQEVHFD